MNTPSIHASSAPSASSPIQHDGMDRLLMSVDTALRTCFASHKAARPCPEPLSEGATTMDATQKREAAALMRVNHVGEVCAQALYASQAWGTNDPALKAQFEEAAREETDHLAWTEQRLAELGGRTSWLNPLWYAGSFAIGLLAAKAGDKISLGFVVETERQVEHHLNSHLDRLPAGDEASRAIVVQMRDDEVAHAKAAQLAGAVELPRVVKGLMQVVAKVMTTTAARI